MFKKGIRLLLLLLISAEVFSHEPAVPLKANHFDLSLCWTLTGGADYNSLWTYADHDLTKLLAVVFMPLTSEFNTSYGGSIFFFEYAFIDLFSLGLRCNLLDTFIYQIRDNRTFIQTSFYLRFNLLDSDFLKINLAGECHISPLYSKPKSDWMGDGLINFYNTLGINYKVPGTGDFLFFVYLDLKYITSFVNTAYGAEYFQLENHTNLPPELLQDVEVSYANVSRFAFALGADCQWKSFQFSLGFNLPLYDFSINPRYSSFALVQDVSKIWFNNFEFSWRWRF